MSFFNHPLSSGFHPKTVIDVTQEEGIFISSHEIVRTVKIMAQLIKKTSERITICHPGAIFLIQKKLAHCSRRIGFDLQACHEISLAGAELAASVLYQGGGGELLISILPENSGIQLETRDRVKTKKENGGAGYNLELLKQFMDDVEVSKTANGDKTTSLSCYRFLTTAIRPSKTCPLEIGVASRSSCQQSNSGDSFVIRPSINTLLVGIITILCNGSTAHRAIQKLRQYVLHNYDKPFKQIFQGADKVCKRTPGASMSLVRLDWTAQPLKMTYGCVGNIEARFNFGPQDYLPLRDGILGKNAPAPFISTQHFPISKTLFLFSEGLSGHWEEDNYSKIENKPAGEIARVMLNKLSKKSHNATLMVVKPIISKGVPLLQT